MRCVTQDRVVGSRDRVVASKSRRREARDSLSIYLQEIECIPVLTSSEEHDIALLAKQGDEVAMEKLVRHNLRFVVSIARQFRRPGTQLEDLINEGNFGLVQAARRFDPDRGCRLVTYARWWIRQSIFNYLTDRSRLVRIPSDKVYDMIRLVRCKDSLLQQLGRTPQLTELADVMSLRADQVKVLQELPVAGCSLNEPSDSEDSTFELDTLADDAVSSEDTIAAHECSEHLHEALSELDSRERDVLLRYYGFDGQDPETLQAIGQDWGITRERVRQLRERALGKIRKSSYSDQLYDYVS